MIENGIEENTTNTLINRITNKVDFDEVIAQEKEKTYTLPEDSILHSLKQQQLPIILYVAADYCPKCVEMGPILESIKQKTEGKVIIEYIDKVKQTEIAQKYPIRLVPTQIFVNADGTPYNGKETSSKQVVKYYDEQGNHTLTTAIGTMTEERIMNMLVEMGMQE
jgi:thioredoxin 1